MSDSQSRLVVITGGSRGIGRMAAEKFAERGDTVVIGARGQAGVDEAVAAITAAGGTADGHIIDVTDSASVDAFFDYVVDTHGVLDICLLNAGVGHWAPLVETTDEQWQSTMRINVDGVFYCTRKILPALIERRAGHIIYVSSVLGRRGVPNMAAYAASKAAVAAFGDSIAAEAKPYRVKVTVMYPGTTSTEMREHQTARPQTPDITDYELQLRPEDVADAILWVTTTSAHAFPTGLVLEPPGTPAK